jgi:hypothetical protein
VVQVALICRACVPLNPLIYYKTLLGIYSPVSWLVVMGHICLTGVFSRNGLAISLLGLVPLLLCLLPIVLMPYSVGLIPRDPVIQLGS